MKRLGSIVHIIQCYKQAQMHTDVPSQEFRSHQQSLSHWPTFCHFSSQPHFENGSIVSMATLHDKYPFRISAVLHQFHPMKISLVGHMIWTFVQSECSASNLLQWDLSLPSVVIIYIYKQLYSVHITVLEVLVIISTLAHPPFVREPRSYGSSQYIVWHSSWKTETSQTKAMVTC